MYLLSMVRIMAVQVVSSPGIRSESLSIYLDGIGTEDFELQMRLDALMWVSIKTWEMRVIVNAKYSLALLCGSSVHKKE